MNPGLLSAQEAATRLGVKRETLYAYVSRGLLTTHRMPRTRGSWFDPVELDALVRKARGPAERRPEVRITSSITLIERGSYWYRGRDPEQLAKTHSYEAVAELLWTGTDTPDVSAWPVEGDAVAAARAAQDLLPRSATPNDRLRAIVALIGPFDPLRVDLRPAGAVATARRLLATTVAALPTTRRGSIAAGLASWLAPRRPSPEPIRAINTTLIVMADHELAASTLAVRVAASFKADPYTTMSAGLGAVAGTWHGGASRQVEELLAAIASGQTAAEALSRVVRGDQPLPGFGHPLYPDGDPRAKALLRLARTFGPTPNVNALIKTAAARHLPRPNVDLGLAALAHTLGLRSGAGETLFGVGRLAGWLAHAIEEYTDRSRLRLRALYTGPR